MLDEHTQPSSKTRLPRAPQRAKPNHFARPDWDPFRAAQNAPPYPSTTYSKNPPEPCVQNCEVKRASVGVDRMRLQVFQIAKRQTSFMRRCQHDLRCEAGLQRFLPARRTQAPLVARLQSWKTPLQIGSRKIVPGRFRKCQKLGRQHHADRMRTHILRPRIAAAITKKAGHRRRAANAQLTAQHVFGMRLPTGAVGRSNSDHNTFSFGFSRPEWPDYIADPS